MEYYDSNDKSAKVAGAIAVSVYVALLVTLFLVVRFDMSYEEPQEGVLVDFGDSEDSGMGEDDMALADDMPLPESAKAQRDEELLTQDSEDAPVVKQTEENPSKSVDSVVYAKTQEKKPEVVPEKREVNKKALFPGNTVDSKSSSSGTTTASSGNQGTMSGRESDKYVGGGSSDGSITFSLGDRRPRSAFPHPGYRNQEQGRVVVEIVVNSVGDVVSAKFRAKGSTTSDARLTADAVKAAYGAKFTASEQTELQTGTIEYNFKLR